MKKKIVILIIILFVLVAGALAWYLISPAFINVEVQEALPEEFTITEVIQENQSVQREVVITEKLPAVTHENSFEKVDYEVEGSYKIINNGDSSLLRIEDLDITNGPDLHFVFSNSNQAFGNNDFASIAELPGNQGSYNIPIPDGVNPADYKYLLIHCVQFSHTFASASLK